MKTDITVVLDRSGSMETIAKDVIKGLNGFVKAQQKVEGDARFTLVRSTTNTRSCTSAYRLRRYQP